MWILNEYYCETTMAKAHMLIFIISFRSCKKGLMNRKIDSLPADRKLLAVTEL